MITRWLSSCWEDCRTRARWRDTTRQTQTTPPSQAKLEGAESQDEDKVERGNYADSKDVDDNPAEPKDAESQDEVEVVDGPRIALPKDRYQRGSLYMSPTEQVWSPMSPKRFPPHEMGQHEGGQTHSASQELCSWDACGMPLGSTNLFETIIKRPKIAQNG